MRLPDPRDHPAPQSHVRHAARSRGHPHARALARRRDGRDRCVGARSSGSTRSTRCGRAPASWRASSSTRAERARPAPSRRSSGARAWLSAAVEINRLENEADRAHQAAVQHALRGGARRHRHHEVEGDPRLPRAGHGSLRGRRQRARRRRRQARLSGWTATCCRRRPDPASRSSSTTSTASTTRPIRSRPWCRRASSRPARRSSGPHSSISSRRFTFGTAVAKTVGSGMVDLHGRDVRGDLRGSDRRDRLGPDHLVLRAADELVARAVRRLCRRGGRQGGLRRRSFPRAGRRR